MFGIVDDKLLCVQSTMRILLKIYWNNMVDSNCSSDFCVCWKSKIWSRVRRNRTYICQFNGQRAMVNGQWLSMYNVRIQLNKFIIFYCYFDDCCCLPLWFHGWMTWVKLLYWWWSNEFEQQNKIKQKTKKKKINSLDDSCVY